MFRYATSVYGGSDLLIGANWDLLKWFVAAGLAFIVVHAAFKAIASPSRVGSVERPVGHMSDRSAKPIVPNAD
jgi:hypothetical protein